MEREVDRQTLTAHPPNKSVWPTQQETDRCTAGQV